MERIIELALLLSEQTDYQEILRLVSQRLAAELQAEQCLILMFNPNTQQTIKTVYHEKSIEASEQFRFFQQQVTGWIVIHKQPFYSLDVKQDHRFQAGLFEPLHVKSVIGIPIRLEGIMIGTIIVFNPPDKEPFSRNDLEMLRRYSSVFAPYLRNTKELSAHFQSLLTESVLLEKYHGLGLIGKCDKFIEMLRSIEAASRNDVRVLLQGASGTGKELVAHAIHTESSRCNHPFVPIDCGAIPADLVESELMGHMKGAFTSADQNRVGLIESADQGVLFMDEIENLPMAMQVKLLRMLQESEVRPVGSNKAKKVDVRIIAATSVDLRRLAAAGQFRDDLFYRLHVYPIQVPTLNERRDDIPLLTLHFLRFFAEEQKKQCHNLHPDILEWFRNRDWPGNIRELKNLLERLISMTPKHTATLTPAMLPADVRKELESEWGVESSELSLPEKMAKIEKEIIVKALTENNFSQTKAAKSLKIPVQTLNYKISRLGID